MENVSNWSIILSSEKLLLYQQRFEEEYDLPDKEYMEWLSTNRPEMFAEKFSNKGERGSVPLSDLFGDIPVALPVTKLVFEFTSDNTRNINQLKIQGMDSLIKRGIQSDSSGKEEMIQQVKMTI